jgi:xylulokinase
MRLLALDIGSSAVKAAVLHDREITAGPVRAPVRSRFEGVRAEIQATDVIAALRTAVAGLGDRVRDVDLIGLATLGPAWVAMDAAGTAITPVVTHADRRSVAEAHDIERLIGRRRHLALTGNRPFPGGIASTTWAWYVRHAPEVMRRADLVGQLPTYLHRRLTGARVIDPSHAAFLGVYRTLSLDGWSEELVAAVGGQVGQLPEVREADAVAGVLTAAGAGELGLRPGTPMLTGCVDGSAAMLAAGAAGAAAGGAAGAGAAGAAGDAGESAGAASPEAGAAADGPMPRAGQLVNVVGSTDVLAMCLHRPSPAEDLLTRPLGVGRRWLAVATVASAGSSLDWAGRTLFPELPPERYWDLVGRVAQAAGEPERSGPASSAAPAVPSVRFEPYLAGERMAIEERRGAFTGLTLATTRQDLLAAVVAGLARVSADRLPRLARTGDPLRTVYVSGRLGEALTDVLHRDWPGYPDGWRFLPLPEATLHGVAVLAGRVR